jgi:hypothetical protein
MQAPHERYRQYGLPVYAAARHEFTPSKINCPKPSDGPVSKLVLVYCYRMTLLPRVGNLPLLHAIDFHGRDEYLR